MGARQLWAAVGRSEGRLGGDFAFVHRWAAKAGVAVGVGSIDARRAFTKADAILIRRDTPSVFVACARIFFGGAGVGLIFVGGVVGTGIGCRGFSRRIVRA